MQKQATTPTDAPQKITKLQLVKNWLLSGKPITHRTSSRMFGYDRLSDGIWKLRRPPYSLNIATIIKQGEDRFLNKVQYGEYRWQGETPLISFKDIHVDLSGGKGTRMYDFWHVHPMKADTVRMHIRNYLRQSRKVKVITRLGFSKNNRSQVIAVTDQGTSLFLIQRAPAVVIGSSYHRLQAKVALDTEKKEKKVQQKKKPKPRKKR
jgi:hypothetical protein